MKTILILTLASALHAAEPQPSFVWQGRTVAVSALERVDATSARLPDGTTIPIAAVPPLLRAAIPPRPPGTLFTNLRVLQILSDGLLMIPQTVVRSDWSKLDKRWIRTEQNFDPIFLRLDHVPDRKNGIQPDQSMTCYAVRDGQYTYIATTGAEKTVESWQWVPSPPAQPKPAILPGGKLTGSALDRK